MKFKELAETLASIEPLSKRTEISLELAKLFNKASPEEAKQIIYFITKKEGYRQIDLGIGENLVIEALARASGYNKEVVKKEFLEKGDLGIVAYELIKNKKQMVMLREEIDILELMNIFNEIKKKEGTGSQKAKIMLMQRLFNLSAIEAKYIARFAVGQMRLGFGEPTIIDALSFAKYNSKEKREEIENAFNLISDLGEVAKEFLENGSVKARIRVMNPLRPALAERLSSAKEIYEKLGRCAIEYKYDGFRMQIHKKGNEVKIFSRRLDEMTYMFPDIVEEVQKIKGDIIFEGEALAYKDDKFYSFQETMQRRRKYDIDKVKEILPLKLFVFDIMYYDGKQMVDKAYLERRKLIEKIFPIDILQKSHAEIVDNEKRIQEIFEEAISKKLEGIMAKDLNAKYTAGKRKFAWIKLKKSYSNIDTIDAVIIGYYKGKGSRAKFGFGGLLLAVYNPERDMFESIAKLGTGFSEEDMKIFGELLEKERLNEKPKNVDAELIPDYWVIPKYVVEVGYDEITRSSVHRCGAFEGKGFALRFPRLIRIRNDKGPEDATTTQEIEELSYK